MESIWSKTIEISSRPPLSGDRKVDIAVSGGGMAGILTAYRLKQNGFQPLVLEERTIASGQTRNPTAKITSQHGLIYNKLVETLGDEATRQYARANQKAIDDYKKLIVAEQLDCDFEEKSAFLYSLKEEDPLTREAEIAAKLGINAAFVNQTELPFAVKGAVRFDSQAQFHPLKFLQGVSKDIDL